MNRLRTEAGYIPDLALVAEEDGQLIGHVMLTKKYVLDDEKRHELLYLAPDLRRAGAPQPGRRQMADRGRLQEAARLGYSSVIPDWQPGLLQPIRLQDGGEFRDQEHERHSGRVRDGVRTGGWRVGGGKGSDFVP